MDARRRAAGRFEEQFGETPEVLVRAPARVNLVGEHTDYNDGFVLPAAIDRELWIALAPSGGEEVHLVSEAFDDPVRFSLGGLAEAEPLESWGVYAQGVARTLAQEGHEVAGWRGAAASDIPVGAGISSSAAMELACAQAFQAVSGWEWNPRDMARVGQRVENEWVGVSSGVMDQLASACGREGHALLLDCRTLEMTPVPLPSELVMAVLDTGTRRDLVGSAYGERRRECEAAARELGVSSLRDLTLEDLERRGDDLDAVLYRRARHVMSENARTLQAADALRSGDAGRLGALIDASHESLRDDFEVSSDAFEAIVGIARDLDGCHGARLTGGGFAGCAMAIVDAPAADAFAATLPRRYDAATQQRATVYTCQAVDGVSIVTG